MGGEPSTYGDVYSFGILLLEMFTGRRPTDEVFKDDLTLHNFVKLALPGQVMEILDQSVSKEVGETCWAEVTECLILVFHIGLACSAASPKDRTDMRRVVVDLLSIRDSRLLGTGTHEKKIESAGNVSVGYIIRSLYKSRGLEH